jgi:hypothetical protein
MEARKQPSWKVAGEVLVNVQATKKSVAPAPFLEARKTRKTPPPEALEVYTVNA